MSNKGLVAFAAVLLGTTGVAVVGGLRSDEEPTGRVRLAVASDANCPRTWRCSVEVVRNGNCLCVTRSESLPGEVAVPADSGLKRKLQICRSTSNAEDYSVRLVPLSSPSAPVGQVCEEVVANTLVGNTFGGIQTEVEEALAARCGLPVTSHTWYCCPHCLLFANGCPPCPQLCLYWDKWKGHEAECPVEVQK